MSLFMYKYSKKKEKNSIRCNTNVVFGFFTKKKDIKKGDIHLKLNLYQL